MAAARNHRLYSPLVELIVELGAVVSFVSDDAFRRLHTADQTLGGGAIMRFAAGQDDGDRLPLASASTWTFVLHLRASGQRRTSAFPFPPQAERCALMWSRSSACRPTVLDRPIPGRDFPNYCAAPSARGDCKSWLEMTILRGAIAPAAAAFQSMHYAADHSAIIDPLYTADVRRQEMLNCSAGGRWRHERRSLPCLRRADACADAQPRRYHHYGQSRQPQGCRRARGDRGPKSSPRLSASLRPRSQPDRASLPQAQGPRCKSSPPSPSQVFGRLSAICSGTSHPKNAPTILPAPEMFHPNGIGSRRCGLGVEFAAAGCSA